MNSLRFFCSRIAGILFRTEIEWERIDAEPARGWGPLLAYALILSLIPALAPVVQRLALAHAPLGPVLILAGMGYAASLLGVAALAGVIDLLAKPNGGEPDLLRAAQLAVYSNTPGWLASLVFVFPIPGFLVLLANLYGLYVLALGLTRMMRTPRGAGFNYAMGVLVSCFMINLVAAWAVTVAGNFLLADIPGALGRR